MGVGLLAGCWSLLLISAAMNDVPDGRAAMAEDGAGSIHIDSFSPEGTTATYDTAIAAACLQGLINRESPIVYMLPKTPDRPQYWLDLLSRGDGWLAGRKQIAIADLDALVELAGDRLKGVVIWDPAVPATLNVATTIAGVRDGVVLSPDMAEQRLATWKLPVIEDLRGRFTGAETGSKKNDAYRWAVREYLAKGLCSSHWMCLYEDAASTRVVGNVGYAITRDWAVKNRSFVFDLSPWGDERPKDDPEQPLGTDLDTYRLILEEMRNQSAGKHMTEMTGFFSFWKYSNIPGFPGKHEPVPTEWETVHLITPYNCYQNTSSSDCYNQSFHSYAPFTPLRQGRPEVATEVEEKIYLCFLMADYDSSYALYDYLPRHWDDPKRGQVPLAWGINPNLVETFPDLITHFYRTATPNDHFTSDASCAGYFNPNRVKPESLPLFVAHNKRFFEVTDMTIAPMVLDWWKPTAAVKDAFREFAPDGLAAMVWDMHTNQGDPQIPEVWKGMPVTELLNDINEFKSTQLTAETMYSAIKGRGDRRPGFYFFRIVWVSPGTVIESLEILRREHPELPIEVLDPYTFFALLSKHCVASAP